MTQVNTSIVQAHCENVQTNMTAVAQHATQSKQSGQAPDANYLKSHVDAAQASMIALSQHVESVVAEQQPAAPVSMPPPNPPKPAALAPAPVHETMPVAPKPAPVPAPAPVVTSSSAGSDVK